MEQKQTADILQVSMSEPRHIILLDIKGKSGSVLQIKILHGTVEVNLDINIRHVEIRIRLVLNYAAGQKEAVQIIVRTGISKMLL